MSISDMITDADQEDRIKRLERRIRKFERSNSEGVGKMSPIIKDLVGQKVDIELVDCNELLNCTVEEVDEEWMRVTEHTKKKDTMYIIRIEDISLISSCDE